MIETKISGGDWRPTGLKQLGIQFIETTQPNPMTIALADGSWRCGKDAEVAGFLREEPHLSRYFDPDLLRRLMAGADGEILALNAALYQSRKKQDSDHCLDLLANLAECRAETDVGASLQLRSLMEATWGDYQDRLPAETARGLLQSAIFWLEMAACSKTKSPMTKRDRAEERDIGDDRIVVLEPVPDGLKQQLANWFWLDNRADEISGEEDEFGDLMEAQKLIEADITKERSGTMSGVLEKLALIRKRDSGDVVDPMVLSIENDLRALCGLSPLLIADGDVAPVADVPAIAAE